MRSLDHITLDPDYCRQFPRLELTGKLDKTSGLPTYELKRSVTVCFRIHSRASGQANGSWQFTTRQSDTAPTDAPQLFGYADGTLPRGMYTLQLAADGNSAKLYVNVGGTIKSATLALS